MIPCLKRFRFLSTIVALATCVQQAANANAAHNTTMQNASLKVSENSPLVKRGSRIIDLIGQRFGRLAVVRFDSVKPSKSSRWECLCECGTSLVTKSCGCIHKEVTAGRTRTHGLTETKTYTAWANMIMRCENKNLACWPNYGGRGISVCAEWRESFEQFYKDIGERPSPQHSLDRIDNEAGYSKSNCRWATRIQQANNRRGNCRIEAFGQKLTLSEWAIKVGVGHRLISNRLRMGWTAERALTEKAQLTGIRKNTLS